MVLRHRSPTKTEVNHVSTCNMSWGVKDHGLGSHTCHSVTKDKTANNSNICVEFEDEGCKEMRVKHRCPPVTYRLKQRSMSRAQRVELRAYTSEHYARYVHHCRYKHTIVAGRDITY